MNRARVMTEILDLSQYTSVEYGLDSEPAYAVMQDLETPEGWTPDRIQLRFEFPERFPEYPPHIYAPEELALHGERPSMLAPPRPDESGDWSRVSLGQLATDWDPTEHDLSTVLSQFLGQLASPVEDSSDRNDNAGNE